MFKRTLKITLKSLLALFTLLLLFVAGRYALAVYQVQKAESAELVEQSAP